MDVYSEFSLPPPPPPGPFSLWTGSERARLPNFNDVNAVAAFVDRLTWYRRPKAYEAQFLFGVVYLFLLGFVIIAIIYKKRQQHAWWLFRLIQRNGRRLIVPQVHNTWTLGASIYGAVCIARFLTEYIYHRRAEPVPHLTLWIILQWIPLSITCLWQAWGISVARPQSLQNASGRSDVKARWWTSSAMITNVTWLSIPVVQALVCLVLALLADHSLQQAYHGRLRWIEKWSMSASLEREMLLDLISIWSHVLRAWFYVCISMCVWAAYSFGLFFVYATVSWRLIASLRDHFRILQREEAEMAVGTDLASTSRVAHSYRLPSLDSPTTGCSGKETQLAAFEASASSPPPVYSQVRSPTPGFRTDDEVMAEVAEPDSPGFAWNTTPLSNATEQEESGSGRFKTFLPHVSTLRRSISISQRSHVHTPQTHTKSQARWVLRYFMIQSSSVSIGILCVQTLPIFLAATLYSAAEFACIERYDSNAYLAGAWVAFVFGTVTLLSIGHATYESSFNQLVEHADEPCGAAAAAEAERRHGSRASIRISRADPHTDVVLPRLAAASAPHAWAGRMPSQPVVADPVASGQGDSWSQCEHAGVENADSYWDAQDRLAQEQRPIQGLLSPEAFRSHSRREPTASGASRRGPVSVLHPPVHTSASLNVL